MQFLPPGQLSWAGLVTWLLIRQNTGQDKPEMQRARCQVYIISNIFRINNSDICKFIFYAHANSNIEMENNCSGVCFIVKISRKE